MTFDINKLGLFIFAGLCSNAANIFTFLMFENIIKTSLYLSGTIAYFMGLFVGYFLNANYTFRVKKSFKNKFLIYFSIQIFIYFFYAIFNIYVISFFVELKLVFHVIGVFLCATLNFIILNYFWRSHASR